MSAVILRHLDALAATMAAAIAQIEATRQVVATMAEPAPTQAPLPDRCIGIEDARCAVRDDGAGTHMLDGAVVCVGCQERLTPQ